MRRHDLTDVRGRTTPIAPNSKFDADMAEDKRVLSPSEKTVYQSIVGGTLYITRVGRPDNMFGVWYLACGMSQPTEPMLKQAIHTLRYLKETQSAKLIYKLHPGEENILSLARENYNPLMLTGFCDSDHGIAHSVSSNIVMFSGAALMWPSKKQPTIALSSVEAETAALTSEAQDIEYARDMLDWCGVPINEATVINCDNRGAIQNAKHPSFSDRLRHVMRKIFYIREVVERKAAAVKWIPGDRNPADLGTKPLGGVAHRLYSEFLLGCPLSKNLSAKFSKLIDPAFRTTSRYTNWRIRKRPTPGESRE